MDSLGEAGLVCVLVVLLSGGCRLEEHIPQSGECVAIHPSGTRFTLTSVQNITGHWTTQLQLDHDADDGGIEGPNTGTWEADVQQKTVTCEATRRIIITATITAPPARPGPGYELIPGHGYYKVHTESSTWEEARRTCVQEGAHLIIINSEAEAKLAKELTSRHSKLGNFIYLGLHDIYTEGHFQSILGQPMASVGYAAWRPSEPNNAHGGEDCVVLVLEDLKLNDAVCTTKVPYICEQQL